MSNNAADSVHVQDNSIFSVGAYLGGYSKTTPNTLLFEANLKSFASNTIPDFFLLDRIGEPCVHEVAFLCSLRAEAQITIGSKVSVSG